MHSPARHDQVLTVALMVPCLANRRPKPLFPLINSGSKFLYDVTSFLPGRPLSAGFSNTLTINSRIRTVRGLP